MLKYFDEKIVSEMFLKAPQQYRDIGGELYTILGDGGLNDELGKLTITDSNIPHKAGKVQQRLYYGRLC